MDNLTEVVRGDHFGILELYEVTLKCKSAMEFCGRQYAVNERFLTMYDVNIALLNENLSYIEASGGKRDVRQIIWEDNKSVDMMIQTGVLAETDIPMLMNAKQAVDTEAYISNREQITLDNDAKGILKYNPESNGIFGYVFNNITDEYERTAITSVNNNEIRLPIQYANAIVIVDYVTFKSNSDIYTVSSKDEGIKNIFSFEGKTKLVNDKDGEKKTGVLRIPKVRILGNINFTLGKRRTPVIGNFRISSIEDERSHNIYSYVILDDFMDI